MPSLSSVARSLRLGKRRVSLGLAVLTLGLAVPTATVCFGVQPAAGLEHAAQVPQSDAWSAVRTDAELVVDTDPAGTEAKVLANAWGVSVETARQWRKTEFALGEFATKAESAAGARLAGSWIEWRPEPHLVVELTRGRAISAVGRAVRGAAGGVDVRYTARHSQTELVQMANLEKNSARRELGVDVVTGVDPVHNLIFVEVPAGASADRTRRDVRAQSARLGVPAVVESAEANVVPANRGGRYTKYCTSGFSVRGNSSGRYGYTVAAHCGNDQPYLWYSNLSARTPWHPTTFMGESFASDVQWHAMEPGATNGQAAEPLFQVSTTEARQQRGIWAPRVGDLVFNWGSRSLNSQPSYGTVVARGTSPGSFCGALVKDPCGNTFVRVEGSATHLRVCRGDSGGPIYSGNLAVGISTTMAVSTRTSECTPSSGTVKYWYAPMSILQRDLGVTLYTTIY